MERRLFDADEALARWLDWVSAPSGRTRWLVAGETWERDPVDGRWWVEREVPSLHEMERDGRRPVVITGDALDAFARAKRLEPSQGDIDDAFRGLEPHPATDPLTGETRLDYEVPLKNADGSLSRYAKNMMDLHAPALAAAESVQHHADALRSKAAAINAEAAAS
jgi:hypothetical protein